MMIAAQRLTLIRAACITTMIVCPIGAHAQDDFRSADDGRPLRVEDAYPLKFQEWEWEVGFASALESSDDLTAGAVLELKTGIVRNWQFGVEVHSALQRVQGISNRALEEFGVHLLFNLNQETRTLPALALRVDAMVPGVGGAAREDVGGRVRGIGTRTIGGTRMHANAAYTFASSEDGGGYLSGGLAFVRPLGLSSRALLGDLYVEVPSGASDVRLHVDVGTRMQISKVAVLDFGVSTRIDRWADGVPNFGFTIGISRVFGLPWAVRVPPYPDPQIGGVE